MRYRYEIGTNFERRLVLSLSFICYFFCVTNRVYLSPLISAVCIACFPLAFIYAEGLLDFQRSLLAYLAATLVSILIYDPRALATFGFYRYDGNFFISYGPLFFLPFLSFRFDIERYFERCLQATSAVIFFFLAFHVVRYGFGISFGFELFTALNAAGGFLCLNSLLALAYYRKKGTAIGLAMLIVNVAGLFFTRSRGSLLGMVVAVAYCYVYKRNMKKLAKAMLVLPLVLEIGLAVWGYGYYSRFDSFKESTKAALAIRDDEFSQKASNVYIRLFFDWPRGIDGFIHSPIFGTGYGAMNDMPFSFRKFAPLIALNTAPKSYNAGHAHHSIFHIVGEQGLVGLVLFLGIWYRMFSFLWKRRGKSTWINEYLMMSLLSIVFAGYTEHRMTTPAMILPFTIGFGLYTIWVRSEKPKELHA